MRTNTYDARSDDDRHQRRARRGDGTRRRALREPVRHDPATAALREAYAMKQRHGARRRRPARADRVLLVDGLGRGDRAPGQATCTYTNNWPHEPLVGNTPPPALWHVVGVQRAVPDRRHRAARLAPRASARTRSAASIPPSDPLALVRDHAVDAGDGEVLLGRDRAVPGADPAGRHHRALPGRRPGGLRLPAGRTTCPTR